MSKPGAAPAGDPFLLFLYLTRRCNLRCRYCFVQRDGTAMKLSEIRRALEVAELSGKKNVSLVFFGGEPLLEWKTLKAAVALSRRGNAVRRRIVSTNCLLLDRRKLDYIAEEGLVLGLSFDGPGTPQAANRPGARGGRDISGKIRLAGEYAGKIDIQVRMTVTPASAGRLAASFRFLLGCGLGRGRINIVPEVYRSRWSAAALRRFEAGLMEVAAEAAALEAKGERPDICFNADLDHFQLFDAAKGRTYSCCAGRNMAAVLPGGDFFPCYFLAGLPQRLRDRFRSGNIHERGARFVPDGVYSALKENRFMGCHTWNYVLGGDPAQTAAPYAGLYKAILRASARANGLRAGEGA